ncbi:thioredoxin family protein [Georgenia muralis]|uniref:Thioredoxin domain-containing protein n=1 Tax=Georgenia muralis TaxID=154117 RepID=A0A3N4Z6R5_9MICO|nr:thioredoxin family protein [Georgenia muralis]RPF26850.1 hypothetical protein EDD32_1308 [Georgenia muralis]
MRRATLGAVLALLAILVATAVAAVTPATARTVPDGLAGAAAGWSGAAAAPVEPVKPTIYYFWGDGCPHCAEAGPFLASLAQTYGATVVDYEVWNHPENREPMAEMAAGFGFEPTGVPLIFLGEEYWVGFSAQLNGAEIEAAVATCAERGCLDAREVARAGGPGVLDPPAAAGPEPAAPAATEVLRLPLLGEVDLGTHSLTVSTALIAVVDGFNPCSLWVLSVLLALTLHSGSRRRTAVIGLTFITVTAAIYGLFITGLFTVLTVVGMSAWLHVLVALVALFFAVVNIKDYFWYRQGLSFTIADERRPGLYRGMRAVLAKGDSLPALVGATVVLAAGVSLVEFSCTAGFPVLWTNLLTSQGATAGTFVLLLALYLLIYQLDELAVFGAAVVGLRATRLQEKQGRLLKLAGGMLMLTLAVVMIVDPDLMGDVGSSLAVFAVALAATALVLLVHRVVLPRLGIHVGSEKSLRR